MNQKLLSQLQSRIDIRRNWIRTFEAEVGYAKSALKSMKEGDASTEVIAHVRDEMKLFQAKVNGLAKDQKLDKRLYSIALDMDDMIRYNRELTAQVIQPVYVITIDELTGATEVGFA